jgi:hypothetical protein
MLGVRLSKSAAHSLTQSASRRASGENLSLQPHHDLSHQSDNKQPASSLPWVAEIKSEISLHICAWVDDNSKQLYWASRFSRCTAKSKRPPREFRFDSSTRFIYQFIVSACARWSAKSTACTPILLFGCAPPELLPGGSLRALALEMPPLTMFVSSPLHTSSLFKTNTLNQTNAQDSLIMSVNTFSLLMLFS